MWKLSQSHWHVPKGDWKVVGLGSATTDYYVDDAKIFLKDGCFPDRFDFTVEKLPKEREIEIMSIIDKLSFVTNLAYWAVFFRNGIVGMSKQDWDVISSKTSSPSSSRS